MKKISILFLSIIMACIISTSAKATSQINHNLLEEMYEIDPDIKIDLAGEEIISVSKKDKYLSDTEESIGGSSATTRGLIPKNKMSLYIAVSKTKNNNYRVVATSTWKSKPIFKFKDTMAIAWGNNHTLKHSYIRVKLHNGKTKTESQVASVTPNVGVARTFKTEYIDRIFGDKVIYTSPKTVTFVALLDTNGKKGSTNVSAGYAHKTFGRPSVSVSFSGSGPSINFGGSLVKFDSMHNYTYFNH